MSLKIVCTFCEEIKDYAHSMKQGWVFTYIQKGREKKKREGEREEGEGSPKVLCVITVLLTVNSMHMCFPQENILMMHIYTQSFTIFLSLSIL